MALTRQVMAIHMGQGLQGVYKGYLHYLLLNLLLMTLVRAAT